MHLTTSRSPVFATKSILTQLPPPDKVDGCIVHGLFRPVSCQSRPMHTPALRSLPFRRWPDTHAPGRNPHGRRDLQAA